MRKRIIRHWWEEDAFTRWRRLYSRFRRPGTAKKAKQQANRYARRVEAHQDVADSKAEQ